MKISKEKLSGYFWPVNAIGWLLCLLLVLPFTSMPIWNSLVIFYLYFASYLSGFIATSLLRYPLKYLEKSSIKSIIIEIILVCILIVISTLIWVSVDTILSYKFWSPEGTRRYFNSLTLIIFGRQNYARLVIISIWVALYYMIKIWVNYQYEKERKKEALALAQTAELEMLRYQLNPHFLFNSLNSVRALINENPKNAEAMITELSEFLRYSLIQKDVAFVTLKRELDAIKHYLAIEKKRFEDDLQIEYKISQKSEKIKILSFILHPIIENAIKHGMNTSKLPLRIQIKSSVRNHNLNICICNSGKWIKNPNVEGTNTGLENVLKRLRNTYNENYNFEINKSDDSVCVKLTINLNSDEEK